MLEDIYINLDELLEDLRLRWLDHKDYNYNKTAFTKQKESGGNIMMCCPYRSETNPSFGILSDYPYTWQCFSCGERGNLIQLVQHVLDLPTIAHAEHYLTRNYIDYSAETRPQLDIDSILDSKIVIKPQSNNLEDYIGKRHAYMRRRGFNERTLSKYEVGFDDVRQEMVMPVRASNGEIRFLKRRSVVSKSFMNQVGVYKKDILYGLYYLKEAMGRVKKVYLTESETDTMACYQMGLPSVSLMGRILFDDQLRELLRAGVEEVVLFLDNDQHGQEATMKIYEKLSKTPIRTSLIKYPIHYGVESVETPYKDANDILKMNLFEELKHINFEDFILLRGKIHEKNF